MMRSNHNLELVKINAHAKSNQIPLIRWQDIQRKRHVELTKGHFCFEYLRKLTRNNPNLDLVNINAYAKFGVIPSIRS